jgi:hypothetical protein
VSKHYDSDEADQPVKLLTTEQVAEMFGMAAGNLEAWRSAGIGPTYIKLGPGKKAPVRYYLRDVLKFVEQGRRSTSSPCGQARG